MFPKAFSKNPYYVPNFVWRTQSVERGLRRTAQSTEVGRERNIFLTKVIASCCSPIFSCCSFVSYELKFHGVLPKESLRFDQLLPSNLLKTDSPLKVAIIKFVAKHPCMCIGILTNQLCRSYLSSRKNGALLKTNWKLNQNDKKLVSSAIYFCFFSIRKNYLNWLVNLV